MSSSAGVYDNINSCRMADYLAPYTTIINAMNGNEYKYIQ